MSFSSPKPLAPTVLALAVSALFSPLAAQAAESASTLPEVTVSASSLQGFSTSATTMEPTPAQRASTADTSSLLNQIAGAGVVRNGPLTGIAELRGLMGDNVNVQVNGMSITPACPNHMDPPLHYITPQTLGTLTVYPGIAPVSVGGDHIGGAIVAESAPPQFGAGSGLTMHGKVNAAADSSNRGSSLLLGATAANDRMSLGYTGQWLNGGNLRWPGGTVADTGYHALNHDLTFGLKLPSDGLLQLDASQHHTRNAGTPALPMDMALDKADSYSARYTGKLGAGLLSVKAYHHTIDHLMDNFSLRKVMPGGMAMQAPATSTDKGAAIDYTLPDGANTWRGGLSWHGNDFQAYSLAASGNPMSKRDNITPSTRRHLGAYGEWERAWTPQWDTRFGLRADQIKTDAAPVTALGMAPNAMTRADQAKFNAATRAFTDNNWDVVLQTRFKASENATYTAGIARKMQSPSLLQRYLWSPANASAGMADGRTYLGNLALQPEVADTLDLGADWHGAGWRIAPSAYYSRVHDYIQGTPIARKDAAGLPVLQYNNVQAELYGLDMNWSLAMGLPRGVSLDGVVSYVRGKRTDVPDNLYRIAPLRATTNLRYATGPWSANLQWVLAAKQTEVSAYNGEKPTGGYGVLNLHGAWQASPALQLTAGLNNLFDKNYADALSGINRVSGGDLPVGARIPGAGRSVFFGLNYAL